MTSFEISRYDLTNRVPANAAEQVSNTFKANYPPSHSDDDRLDDVINRANAESVKGLLELGNTLYVASPDASTVAGFIESRTITQPEGVYEQLAWIMTNREYRGQHLASLLHGSFIIDASLRAIERTPKPTRALLSVHEQNPARSVYERWGYSIIEKTTSGKLLMTKDLPEKQ